MSTIKTVDKLVEDYIKVPENIQFYINAAISDLYYGPRGSRDDDPYEWHGFKHAVNIIGEWYDNSDFGNDLWVDTDCDSVSDNEPECDIDEETGDYIEPYWASIYHYESKDIKNVIFGKELASYI